MLIKDLFNCSTGFGGQISICWRDGEHIANEYFWEKFFSTILVLTKDRSRDSDVMEDFIRNE